MTTTPTPNNRAPGEGEQGPREQAWTRETPTQEGRYLLWTADGTKFHVGTISREYDGALSWIDDTSPHVSWGPDILTKDYGAYWIGPIVLPKTEPSPPGEHSGEGR